MNYRITHRILLALCLISAVSAPPAYAKNSAKPSLKKTLEAIVANPERPLTGLSVLVVKNGKIVYDGNFGKRQIDPSDSSKGLPVDKDTKFRIASISKVEVAIGVMQLVEQNKIDLDADISCYLGFKVRNPNFPDTPVTVRMLLSHTSSVRDGERYSFPATDTMEEALVEGGKNWEKGAHWAKTGADGVDQSPGQYFTYANLNYGLLGTIIEAASGERFDKYMRAHVFQPLGCKASFNIQDFSPAELKQVSVLYRKMDEHDHWNTQGPWYPQFDDYKGGPAPTPKGSESYVLGKNASWLSPQGGLRISALDLSKVMRMFMNGGEFNGACILKPETVKLMFTPQWKYDKDKRNGETYDTLMGCYGLGPQILTNYIGDRILEKNNVTMNGHIGDANGLLSCMMMDLERKDGFIMIMGGVGADPEKNRGSYSGFFKWEEEIATAIFQTILAAENYKSNSSTISQTKSKLE